MTPFCLLLVGVQLALSGASLAAADGEAAKWTAIGAIVASVLAFLTGVSTLVFNIYAENRRRRWKIEDDARAEQHDKDARARGATLIKKLDENTEITKENVEANKQAIEVANNLNEKVAAAHETAAAALSAVQQQQQAPPRVQT